MRKVKPWAEQLPEPKDEQRVRLSLTGYPFFRTPFALKFKAQELPPTLLGQDPFAEAQRRLVAHMLTVPARQHGHPIAHLILSPTDDAPFHKRTIDEGR